MFRITANIRVKIWNERTGDYLKTVLKFPASSIKWNVGIDNYFDTASFIIPAMCRMKTSGEQYNNIQAQYIEETVLGGRKEAEEKNKNSTLIKSTKVFKQGDKVEIYAGYDGKNDLQFKGFISRINFTIPVEIMCEGYAYQLRTKIINKSFPNTTIKELLYYLIADTGIQLSDKCPERIDFRAHQFKNKTGLQVLDYLKEEYGLTVFFQYHFLYVGWRATYKGEIVKHRLNWNVIESKELLFNTYTGSTVNFVYKSRFASGAIKKIRANNIINHGEVKEVQTVIQSDSDMQLSVNDRQLKEDQKGYTGKITGFLKPFVRPGMTTEIIDKKYSERNGRYFIESVEGSVSDKGGRQTIGVSFALSAPKSIKKSN
ncbi:MAG: hypothetical protein ABIN97_20905 [Ginsengibacter sp.]